MGGFVMDVMVYKPTNITGGPLTQYPMAPKSSGLSHQAASSWVTHWLRQRWEATGITDTFNGPAGPLSENGVPFQSIDYPLVI